MMDFNNYVGIPFKMGGSGFKGADCWGIITLFYRDVFGVNLEDFKLELRENEEDRSDLIDYERNDTGTWEHVFHPDDGDVAIMYDKSTSRPNHVGVYAGNGMILHGLDGSGYQSQITSAKLIKRMFKRVSYYKYVG